MPADMQRSLDAIAALIRAAECDAEDARVAYHDALLEQNAAEKKHEAALQQLTAGEQLIRDILGESRFSVDSLIMANYNQRVLNDALTQQQRILQDADQRLADCHQKLIAIRVKLKLYQRLHDRKIALLDQERQRQLQHELDATGTLLKGFGTAHLGQFSDKGMMHGN